MYGNCSVALIVNLLDSSPLRKRLQFSADLGLPSTTVAVRNLWERKDLGTMHGAIDVEVAEAHDCALYKLCPLPVH